MITREWQVNIELNVINHRITGAEGRCFIENVGPRKLPHWLERAIIDACEENANDIYDATENAQEEEAAADDRRTHADA